MMEKEVLVYTSTNKIQAIQSPNCRKMITSKDITLYINNDNLNTIIAVGSCPLCNYQFNFEKLKTQTYKEKVGVHFYQNEQENKVVCWFSEYYPVKTRTGYITTTQLASYKLNLKTKQIVYYRKRNGKICLLYTSPSPRD